MRLLLVTGLVFFGFWGAALAAPSEITRLPTFYVQQAQGLAASCGADRAQTIANLTWDIDIHADWLKKVQSDPSLAKVDGSPSWHGYWISVYKHTIQLLEQDCSASS